jgi:hypothetical protein
LTNCYSHAEVELSILSAAAKDPNNRPIIEPFKDEILALCEKFGKSGQSGGSAPYTASAITQALQKLLLFETIAPITGEDHEWNDVTSIGDTDKRMYQNNRNSAIFKDGESGKAYYIDAIVKRVPNGSRWSGPFWLTKEDYLSGDESKKMNCRGYIKSFPFEPRTFVLDVIEEEVAKDDWEMYVKDPKQLEEIYKYYDKQ